MHVKCQASVSEFFLLVPIFCINYIHVHVLCRFWCYTCICHAYTSGRFTYLFPCVHLSFRLFFLHFTYIPHIWLVFYICFFFIFDNHYSTVSFWTFFFFLISIVFSFSWSKLPKFITYIRYMFSLHVGKKFSCIAKQKEDLILEYFKPYKFE